MKSVLIFTILSVVISAGIPSKKSPNRIVGGIEVSPKFRYPWIVSLDENGIHACGGTLYNTNTVISAAHCYIDAKPKWTARVHRHDLDASEASEQGKTYKVKSIFQHPKYKKDEAYDVAIFKLETEVPFTEVKLDNGKYANADGTNLKVIGWGATSFEGDYSSKLLEVQVPVVDSDKCKKVYEELNTKAQFCAAHPDGGKDGCQGDSGGPIFIEEGNTTILVGIVSWGEDCGKKGYPGVYTRVSAVTSFIDKHSR